MLKINGFELRTIGVLRTSSYKTKCIFIYFTTGANKKSVSDAYALSVRGFSKNQIYWCSATNHSQDRRIWQLQLRIDHCIYGMSWPVGISYSFNILFVCFRAPLWNSDNWYKPGVQESVLSWCCPIVDTLIFVINCHLYHYNDVSSII